VLNPPQLHANCNAKAKQNINKKGSLVVAKKKRKAELNAQHTQIRQTTAAHFLHLATWRILMYSRNFLIKILAT